MRLRPVRRCSRSRICAAGAATAPMPTGSTCPGSSCTAARWWPSPAPAAAARARCWRCSDWSPPPGPVRGSSGSAADAIDLGAVAARCPAPLAHLRAAGIGFVMQTGGLLPFLTVRENLVINRRLLGLPEDTRTCAPGGTSGARRLARPPGRLSVGQQQRASIGRALAHRPPCCWPTSPPRHWTRAWPVGCCRCCSIWPPRSAPPSCSPPMSKSGCRLLAAPARRAGR